jgi:hypothetical protein
MRALAAGSAIGAATYLWTSFSSALSYPTGRIAAAARNAAHSKAAKSFPSRPIYPYSVIRGGAYSAVELSAALDRDPVAARHYRPFRRSSVRTVKSTFSEPVFLSYRVSGVIYWTGHPVRLPPAETLLTDGQNYARARCGNRISQTPQTPVNETEPAPETLNTPEPPASSIADLDTWSDNRLPGDRSNAPVQLLPGQPLTVSAVADSALEGSAIPSWWGIAPPTGALSVPVTKGTSAVPLPPGGTAPLIEPNPIPGLVLPPMPVAPTGFTPEAPPEIWPSAPIVPIGPGIPEGPIAIAPQTPAGTTQQVPEPAMQLPTLLACAAFAAAKFLRRP